MGLKFSSLFSRIFGKTIPEMRIGMMGLDNAGKTTILYQLKLERNVHAAPTIGFNVETVRFHNMLLNIWDVSGRPRTRQLWEHYNQNTHAIIFVVDAADTARFQHALEELQWLLWRPHLENTKILLFANKQDLVTAVGAEELAQQMQMHKRKQPWVVQECCAINGSGLHEGLEKLTHILNVRKNL